MRYLIATLIAGIITTPWVILARHLRACPAADPPAPPVAPSASRYTAPLIGPPDIRTHTDGRAYLHTDHIPTPDELAAARQLIDERRTTAGVPDERPAARPYLDVKTPDEPD